MGYIHSLILGIVEGLSEFLPISSTAHLILSSKLLGLSQTDFVKTFEISIQLGAILAVVWLYWKKFLIKYEVLKRIVIAFLPTAVLGLLAYKIVKNYLLESYQIIIGALFLGGIFLIVFDLLHKEKEKDTQAISKIPFSKCFLIGIFQSIAMIPGVSRAGATIVGGLILGLSRKTIVEFSFLLAIPTMLAATGYDLLKSGLSFSGENFIALGIGFVVAFLVALITIKFFIKYVQNNNFILFGIYRIIISIIFFLWVI
ncbi:undecaprenyl-diphosphate phosphatase [Patescibacteria group bacterium]|nr:undecaprenyl-diphosphate phosphatase [Patescibacteria group bacterium]